MNDFTEDKLKTKQIAPLIEKLLTIVGEDVNRDGLKETPKRAAKAYQEMLQGYTKSPKDVFKIFDSEGFEGIIAVSDINFHSLCEHHIVPFFGQVHIGYIPDGKILGLSKFGRLVEIYARRLQVQEKMTKQIADDIMKYLHPKGVIVVSQAEHLCMNMRGVKKIGSVTKIITKRGIFAEQKELVDEFFLQISSNK
jgi:GTP cyclohydrolase I